MSISELANPVIDPPTHWAGDKYLWLALLLALLFCAYGMHWGVAGSWHPDQYVYRNLFQTDQLPFHPQDFLKPPFHTYLSFFLVRAPIYALSYLLEVPDYYRRIVELLSARLLATTLFMGQVVLVFIVSRRFFGLIAARAASLLLATSAGFVAFSHFLTVDIPVTFWMLLAFWSAQNILLRGRMQDYVLAGLFTGVAAATKYNGLAIGISIVVAHWLSSDAPFLVGDWSVWKRRLFASKLLLGVATIVIGFILANPFAVLDYSEFVNDFMYNMVTTPAYGGAAQHIGYWVFFERIGEIFGLPVSILLSLAVVVAVLRLGLAKAGGLEVNGVLMLVSVIALYYAYFGSFGRLPTRFVLPVAPYWLMLVGPLCAALRPRYLALPLAAVVAYNTISSVYVGWRFSNEPRMLARTWINDHIPQGSSIEYTNYTPRPERFPWKHLQGEEMPGITGRVKLFRDILAENSVVQQRLYRFEGDDAALVWYSADALTARSPDYVWMDSKYYERFFSDVLKDYYPGVRQYFEDLLEQNSNYAIVFDAATPDLPWWIYPQEIDFLENRITILQRRTPPP